MDAKRIVITVLFVWLWNNHCVFCLIARLIVDIILAISSFSLACPMLLFIADVWKQVRWSSFPQNIQIHMQKIQTIVCKISNGSLLCNSTHPPICFLVRFPQAFEEQNILKLDLALWILIVYVLILPSTFIRRPDFFGWWSLIANIIEVITIVSLFVNIFFTSSSWKVQTSVEWSKIPLTIGIVFYAFEIAPFVSLSIHNNYCTIILFPESMGIQ